MLRFDRTETQNTQSGTGDRMIKRYLTWLRESRGATPSTLSSYTETLTKLAQWCEPKTASTADLEAFVLRPRRNGLVGAPATRTREMVCMRSFYMWALRQGLVDHDPAADLIAPKVPARQPKPIPDEAWLDAWLTAPTEDAKLILGLAMFCGLRREEIARLAPHNVDVIGHRLIGFIRKGSSDDVVPYGDLMQLWAKRMPHLRADLFEPVLRRAAKRTSPVLLYGYKWPRTADGTPNLSVLTNRVRKWTDGYGPHTLRHAFCSNAIRAGLPLAYVQKLANHASPVTTSGYIKIGGQELKEWLRGNERLA